MAETKTLVDQLAEQIRQRLIDQQLPRGSWLRQETLAHELEVSRTPIREALRKLEQAGLVEFVANRGFRVRQPTAPEIEEAYVVRAELEGLAAERAAERITDGQLSALYGANDLFQRAGQAFVALDPQERRTRAASAEWVLANDRFHTVVHDAAQNERLRAAILDVHRAFPRSLTSLPLVEDTALMLDNIAEHQTILRALAIHDPAASREAMKRHVLIAGRLVQEWFAPTEEPDAR